jgi:outer membrane protein TolC
VTLEDALAYAREHQPSLLAARARLAAIQADARVPRALYLPRLAATAQAFEGTANNSTAAYLGAPGVDLPRIGGTRAGTDSWSPYPSTVAALGLRQEVFDFGRIAALEAVTDSAVLVERSLSEAARLDVDFAVEDAFFAVQAARGVLDAAASAWQRSRLNRDTAAAGVKAGLRSPIELTRAEAELSRFEIARVRAEAGLSIAQGVLAAVVGAPELRLDAAGGPPVMAPAPSLDEVVRAALENEPALRARRASAEQQRAVTRAIGAELRPDLQLTASVSGRAGDAPPTSGAQPSGAGWIPNVPNWDGGLVLSWPLFDGAVRARASASRAREAARDAEIQELQASVTAASQQAWLDLDAAQQALPSLEKSLEAGRANYAQAQARFKAGLGSSVELADAQELLAEAEVELAVGRYRLARARVHLGRVMAQPR